MSVRVWPEETLEKAAKALMNVPISSDLEAIMRESVLAVLDVIAPDVVLKSELREETQKWSDIRGVGDEMTKTKASPCPTYDYKVPVTLNTPVGLLNPDRVIWVFAPGQESDVAARGYVGGLMSYLATATDPNLNYAQFVVGQPVALLGGAE